MTRNIESLFTGKTFVIPAWQREYAWTEDNIDELCEDVAAAVELGISHHLGSIILKHQKEDAPLEVIDGHQRLITLSLLIDALAAALADEAMSSYTRNTYIHSPVRGAKLRMSGSDEIFFRALLADTNPDAVTEGQRAMQKARDSIRQRVSALHDRGGQDLIRKWLDGIRQMSVEFFIAADDGAAFSTFGMLKQRGLPPAELDAVRGVLVHYSNRYLGGELDSFIIEQTGKVRRSLSHIRQLAGRAGDSAGGGADFSEETLLHQHGLAFAGWLRGSAGDLERGRASVVEHVLKPTLKVLRGDVDRLRAFMISYVPDMVQFFTVFEDRLRTGDNT